MNTAEDGEEAEIDPELLNQQVIRGINGILNKLTVEKFEALYKKLIGEVGMCAESHIVVLTKQLFTKSTTQHHFIEMYTICVSGCTSISRRTQSLTMPPKSSRK